jgi:ribosomal protein S6
VPALEEATRVLRITDGVLRFMAVAKPPAKAAAAPAEKVEEPEQAEAPA